MKSTLFATCDCVMRPRRSAWKSTLLSSKMPVERHQGRAIGKLIEKRVRLRRGFVL